MQIDTTAYLHSHARMPRGRGNWAFGATRDAAPKDMVFLYGSYAEAKRRAVEIAKTRGWDVLVVLP